jgi:hypothetical protein
MWECDSKILCETFPDDVPQNFPILRAKDKDKGFKELWGRVVEGYTQGLLTNVRDKLVAISGVVKTFEDRYKGQYLYGTWTEHLPTALVWWSGANERILGHFPFEPLHGHGQVL